MPQRNALPNQRSTGSMICPRSFNNVATRPDHWQSLCRTGIVCQRFRVGPGFEEGQGLKGLIDDSSAPTEIGFTPRHEDFERQDLRHAAATRLQRRHNRRGTGRLFEPLDLPDALTGVAAILLDDARSCDAKLSRKTPAKFLSAAIKTCVGAPAEMPLTVQHLFDAHFEDLVRMRTDKSSCCSYVEQQRAELLSCAVAFKRIHPHQCAIGLHELCVNVVLHFL